MPEEGEEKSVILVLLVWGNHASPKKKSTKACAMLDFEAYPKARWTVTIRYDATLAPRPVKPDQFGPCQKNGLKPNNLGLLEKCATMSTTNVTPQRLIPTPCPKLKPSN